MGECTAAVLYSGGTDSTCAAALMSEKFADLHLLTFRRFGFHNIENASKAARSLREKFPAVRITHEYISIDRLFRHLAYHDYFRRVRWFGFFMLQNCTFCALANHARALVYCIENGISHVADGVTRELPYLPSHMEKPIERLKTLYNRYGITYHTPVYDFDIPREMNFFDKIFLKGDDRGVELDPGRKTTGTYLHDLGIMPSENIKGSSIDRKFQYRCFQYILHNLVAFCVYLPAKGRDYTSYEHEILRVYEDGIRLLEPLLDDLAAGKRSGALQALIEDRRP